MNLMQKVYPAVRITGIFKRHTTTGLRMIGRARERSETGAGVLGWIHLSVHPRSRASSTRRRAGLGRPPVYVSTADRLLYYDDVTSVTVQSGGWGGREGGKGVGWRNSVGGCMWFSGKTCR